MAYIICLTSRNQGNYRNIKTVKLLFACYIKIIKNLIGIKSINLIIIMGKWGRGGDLGDWMGLSDKAKENHLLNHKITKLRISQL